MIGLLILMALSCVYFMFFVVYFFLVKIYKLIRKDQTD